MSILDALRSRLGRRHSLQLSWLTSDLAISRSPLDAEWPDVEAAGVRSLLDLRETSAPGRPPKDSQLRYLRLPIVEYEAPTSEQLDEAAQWVVESITRGPVLIHCREGMGRSPLVACAALVRLGIPLSDAYEILRRTGRRVAMTDAQVAALDAFTSRWGRDR